MAHYLWLRSQYELKGFLGWNSASNVSQRFDSSEPRPSAELMKMTEFVDIRCTFVHFCTKSLNVLFYNLWCTILFFSKFNQRFAQTYPSKDSQLTLFV